MISKKQLAVFLSSLKTFDKPDLMLEQYPTDSEIASEILWNAYMSGEIQGKRIADLGSGTGILGIGALILGAKEVFFVDINSEVMELLKLNLETAKKELKFTGKSHFLVQDVKDFDEKVDLVIENPPFGTKSEHADRTFLEKAFSLSPLIYTFHKSTSKAFIDAFSRDKGFKISQVWSFDFPLKKTFTFHKKRIQRISVSCWKLQK